MTTDTVPVVDDTHHYLSTACHHGLCRQNKCRLTCKYCDAPCMCRCHREDLQRG